MKDEVASAVYYHDYILIFTRFGKVYRMAANDEAWSKGEVLVTQLLCELELPL